MGWGQVVSDDLRQYLHEVADAFAAEREEDAEPSQLQNVLEELSGHEQQVSTDVQCSRYLETLLGGASAEQVAALLEVYAEREMLWSVATNPFGSHVLETLLRRLVATSAAVGPHGAAQKGLSELCALVKDDITEFISSKHATHFVRALVQLLAGTLPVRKPDSGAPRAGGSGLAEKLERVQALSGTRVLTAATALGHDALAGIAACPTGPSEDSSAQLRAVAVALMASTADTDMLVSLQRSAAASGFMQSLYAAVQHTDIGERFFVHMLGCTPGNAGEPAAALERIDARKMASQLKHKAASHLMEALLLHTPATCYGAVWAALRPQLEALCLNPVANFAAQSLLAAAPSAEPVTDAHAALGPRIAELLRVQRHGVVCVLATTAASWRTAGEQFCAALERSQHEQAVAKLLMLDQPQTLAAAGASGGRGDKLSLSGCLVLQALLAMPQNACNVFTDELAALPAEQLGAVARDASGARVIEAFMQGSGPTKLKRQVLARLHGEYASLAQLPAPSRLVEALYLWADIEDKQLIAGALAGAIRTLQDSKYGVGICKLCQLETYKRSTEEWRARAQDTARTAAQYQKLFGTAAVSKRKLRKESKKRKREHECGASGVLRNGDGPIKPDMRASAVGSVASDVMATLGIPTPDSSATISSKSSGKVPAPSSAHGHAGSTDPVTARTKAAAGKQKSEHSQAEQSSMSSKKKRKKNLRNVHHADAAA